MPSKVPEGETRGWIVPIGGAENKENDPRILQRFTADGFNAGEREPSYIVEPADSDHLH